MVHQQWGEVHHQVTEPDKSNKYAHFATDITHINTTVTAFEISSTGNVSSDNKKRLTSLHKFCKSGIKLSTFIKNIPSLSIYSSYHIWLCRNDPVFVTPSYLPAPFQPNPTSAAASTAVRAPIQPNPTSAAVSTAVRAPGSI